MSKSKRRMTATTPPKGGSEGEQAETVVGESHVEFVVRADDDCHLGDGTRRWIYRTQHTR
jgi:hypothetical protein